MGRGTVSDVVRAACGLVLVGSLVGCSTARVVEAPGPASTLGQVERVPASALRSSEGPRSRLGTGAGLSSVLQTVARTLSTYGATTTPEGTVLTVPEQVLFDFDSAALRAEAEAALADIAQVIAYYETAPVQVRGHTDARGTEAYNQALSAQRADAVLRQLVDVGGVDPARITARGLGETQPIAPNQRPDGSDDPEGRQTNRRVEIVVETAAQG